MKLIITVSTVVGAILLVAPSAALARKQDDAFATEAKQQHEARRAENEDRQERKERLEQLNEQHQIDRPAVLDDEPLDEPED